ncbi:Histone deacetylase 1 [Cucumispora dikerogammari]|nr:Histone deacetylase 1 [Cucumispora dikerogammari]
MSDKRISYFYNKEIGFFEYNNRHPMKPQRVKMTHDLIVNYGLFKHMDVFTPQKASFKDMIEFHEPEYVKFLRSVSTILDTGANDKRSDAHDKYNIGDDCPLFEGLYEFCKISVGGSLCSALQINRGVADIAINWGGGLHHAKHSEASGFCYINDIVLCILELLKYNRRVMYVDIDVHHGDGVEEAFYNTDRVMTVSLHKYGDFFPGTGSIKDIGLHKGRGYAVNVPFNEGVDDQMYETCFKKVVGRCNERFKPDVIVLQSGTDSLAGDRLGCFNLSMEGHASCIKFLKTLQVPLVVLGGGGYTIKNVSRTWAYETAVICDVKIPKTLPATQYLECFGPNYTLDVLSSNMENKNSRDSIENVINIIYQNLNEINAPNIQLMDTPDSLMKYNEEEIVEDLVE